MPGQCGRPYDPLPAGGIAIAIRLRADTAEFAQLPRLAAPYMNRRTLPVQAGHERKARMAHQTLDRASTAYAHTRHGLEISHAETVAVGTDTQADERRVHRSRQHR